MRVRRGYRQEARRGTQATPHRFATQDGTIFEQIVAVRSDYILPNGRLARYA
jgi:hypothetical protein